MCQVNAYLIQVLVAVGTNCIAVCRFGTDLARPVFEGIFSWFPARQARRKKRKKIKNQKE